MPEHLERSQRAAKFFTWAQKTGCADNWLSSEDANRLESNNSDVDTELLNIHAAAIEQYIAVPNDTYLWFHDEPQVRSHMQDIRKRPATMFVRGTLRYKPPQSVAVVGARRSSERVLDEAYDIGRSLVNAGVEVVSGMAAGVDAQAHIGALDGGGRTVAVLGTGIDQCFPAENSTLKARIERTDNVLLSQFPLGQCGSKTSFTTRNAVIAALSHVSLAVYCEERSGTRNELRHALECKRPVFLWAPAMSHIAWAKQWVKDEPLVNFADTVEDILEAAVLPRASTVRQDTLLGNVMPAA